MTHNEYGQAREFLAELVVHCFQVGEQIVNAAHVGKMAEILVAAVYRASVT